VVINPSHFATALFYEEDETGAPRVVASGRDLLAKEIIDAARAYGVPVVRDVPVGGQVTQITAGIEHTCALVSGGTVRCWGAGSFGRLGYGSINNIGDNEPASSAGSVNLGGAATAVVAGGYNTCAILTGGGLRCWGEGTNGRTGQGDTQDIGDNEVPSEVGQVDIGGSVIGVAVSGHTCALLSNGNVRCFGFGGSGRLGYGNTNNIGDNESPASAGNVNVGGTARLVSATGNHSCVLLDAGGVRCWGDNPWGQLGYGNTSDIGDNETPASAGDVPIQ
jgi:alpha-tubulin suppressor-like RCC1 family protein